MRLIDADALLRVLGVGEDCDNCQYKQGVFCKQSSEFVDACEAIADAPTIEPERNKGKWVKAERDGCMSYSEAYAECDQCNDKRFNGWKMNFCPNCGADMRGEKNEQS